MSNNEVIQALKTWREALASGKYTAYKSSLGNVPTDSRRFCCLGVYDIAVNNVTPTPSWCNAAEPDYSTGVDLREVYVSADIVKYASNITEGAVALSPMAEGISINTLMMNANDGAIGDELPGSSQYAQVIQILDKIIEEMEKSL